MGLLKELSNHIGFDFPVFRKRHQMVKPDVGYYLPALPLGLVAIPLLCTAVKNLFLLLPFSFGR